MNYDDLQNDVDSFPAWKQIHEDHRKWINSLPKGPLDIYTVPYLTNPTVVNGPPTWGWIGLGVLFMLWLAGAAGLGTWIASTLFTWFR